MKMNSKGFGRKHSWLSPGTVSVSVTVMMIIIYIYLYFIRRAIMEPLTSVGSFLEQKGWCLIPNYCCVHSWRPDRLAPNS
jgi:hypothetical protein